MRRLDRHVIAAALLLTVVLFVLTAVRRYCPLKTLRIRCAADVVQAARHMGTCVRHPARHRTVTALACELLVGMYRPVSLASQAENHYTARFFHGSWESFWAAVLGVILFQLPTAVCVNWLS